MSSTTASTPFTLGAYISNPDDSSVVNEALFESGYTSFTSLMNAVPRFLDSYVDQTQAISSWVGNSQWAAASFAASASAKNATPVIALPLSSTAAGALSADASYQAFASGKYDSAIQGIVKAWADDGFKTLVFRPGWEMNLEGPTYAGDTAQDQADWVAAFKHVYTVLHQAAAADGVSVQVVWNPGVTNYSNAEATTNLYPGNDYVDVIGADAYSDIHPYSDGTNASGQATYHDWDTGAEDTSTAQFIADPVNRDHYWTYPAGTEWSTDGSGGHSQSLDSLIQFAEQQGKPFAIPETGAGNSDNGTDVSDDAAYPQWLAQQLTTAEANGLNVDFVGIWDSNGGGNYQFSLASDDKPAEAAAWAKYFGAQASTQAAESTAATAVATTIGSGSDVLALSVAEDAWEGDARYTVSVDGVQVGDTQTAVAIRSAGQTQTVDVLGNFGSGSHTVSVDFLNDAYGGSTATDRNLFVTGATINGSAVSGSALSLWNDGGQSFSFGDGAQPDTLDLHVAEDAWQGDAEYTISINGTTIGGVRTATASHAAGTTQDVLVSGNWGTKATVGVTFINDAYGGSASTDRNLYVTGATYDGQSLSDTPATLLRNGTATLSPPAGTVGLTLSLAEDAWNSDAQYSVTVDGKTLVKDGTVTASHAQGASQSVNLQAVLSAGTHDVAVSFLNDAYGGSASADRNLYVDGLSVNAKAVDGATATLLSNGTDHYQITVPAWS